MATIVTRAGKGSALTWTEADDNITNLNTAKIENVVEDLTPQLGGDLDVNGKAITSASNGNVRLEPNGSGNIALTPTTGKIILGALDFPTGTGTNGQVLTTNGSTGMSWSTPSTGLTDVVNDTTPQLGGNLDVNGNAIVSASNGNIAITPNGTGSIVLDGVNWPQADGTADQVLKTNGTGQLSWTTVSGGSSTLDSLTDVVITAAATNDVLVYNGTNWVDTAANTLTVSAASTATTATTATTVTLVATDSTNATHYVTFTDAATGNENIRTDTGLVYNPSTGILGATQFNGIHNGAHNGTVGATTANTGAFTTLSASSTVNGSGFTALFTSPTGIGSTTPNTGTFTALSARGSTNNAKLTLDTNNVSSIAWTTNGIGLKIQAATFTDSTSTAGTIAASHVNAIATPTMASTNAITVTDAGTLYIADGPTAGTNTTITNKWALLTGGNIKANMFSGAHNGTVGATTPTTGAFTTLSASGVATLGGTTFPSATGTTGQVLALSSAGAAAWTTASSGGGIKTALVYVSNPKGTLVSGTTYRASIEEWWDPSSIISVASNTVTCASAGTYMIELDNVEYVTNANTWQHNVFNNGSTGDWVDNTGASFNGDNYPARSYLVATGTTYKFSQRWTHTWRSTAANKTFQLRYILNSTGDTVSTDFNVKIKITFLG